MRNIWHIDYIAIDPSYQNKGYGRLLLNKMIKKYKYLTLECESNLIKYYNKF
jgi:ribosomal protein S18 acetylase RimI-like enzyme